MVSSENGTSSNSSKNEKRKHPRKTYDTKVNFTSEEKFGIEYIKDISVKGIFIETAEEFSIGQILNLSIPYANQERFIKVKGKVVRITPEGIGVEFLK